MKSQRNSLPSSNSLRSRNLSFRRKTARTQTQNNHVEVEAESRSDQGRLKIILENLDIRFMDCTFTYKQSHFDAQPSATATRRLSKLSSLRNRIFNSIERVREVITCEKTFNQCLFIPVDEKEKLKDFIRTNFPDIKLSFENCKFIKRSSTLPEKITRKLRKIFGIQFELEYINSTATINSYTFRVKDILLINQHIQERIVEEG